VNLEAAEQRALKYLKEASRPLVPVDRLLRHLQDDPACAEITEEELLAFLRKHELFKVIEPLPPGTEPALRTVVKEAGLPLGVCVMLSTRVPTGAELSDMMQSQVDALIASLQAAALDARKRGKPDRTRQIMRMIARAQQLKEGFAELE
jgi:hypothetical protein